jgi:hypothetical protein
MLDSERYISNAASEPISAFLPYIWPYIFMHRAATFSDEKPSARAPLKDAELNYPVHKKELLTIISA